MMLYRLVRRLRIFKWNKALAFKLFYLITAITIAYILEDSDFTSVIRIVFIIVSALLIVTTGLSTIVGQTFNLVTYLHKGYKEIIEYADNGSSTIFRVPAFEALSFRSGYNNGEVHSVTKNMFILNLVHTDCHALDNLFDNYGVFEIYVKYISNGESNGVIIQPKLRAIVKLSNILRSICYLMLFVMGILIIYVMVMTR